MPRTSPQAPLLSKSIISHPKPTHRTTTRALLRRLSLHLLADLQIDLEELAHASIEAHALALVEVRFAVFGGDAFLGAGLGESISITKERKRQACSVLEGLLRKVAGEQEGGGCVPVEHV